MKIALSEFLQFQGEGNDETTASPDAQLTFLFTTPVNNKGKTQSVYF